MLKILWFSHRFLLFACFGYRRGIVDHVTLELGHSLVQLLYRNTYDLINYLS